MVAQVRLVERGEWDPQKLGVILRDLTVQDLDFDLDITGFDVPEIDIYIEVLTVTMVPTLPMSRRRRTRGQPPGRPLEARPPPHPLRRRPGPGQLPAPDGGGAGGDRLHRPAL